MNNILARKQCRVCKEVKSVSEFYKHKDCSFGVTGTCKVCQNKKGRVWHEKNKEKAHADHRNYYLSNKESFRERNRKWEAENREKIREHQAKFREENRERLRETSKILYRISDAIREQIAKANRKWKQNNKDKVRSSSRNYRAKRNGNGGTITAKEWKELCEKYGNKCLRCGRFGLKLTLDHVIPISLGGPNTIDNAQPLCLSCNSGKQARIADYR